LNEADWDSLQEACLLKSYEMFKPVFETNSPSINVYILLKGQISIIKPRHNSYDKQTLDQEGITKLGSGCLIGESGVLYNEKRSAGAVAYTQCICIEIQGQIFQKILGKLVLSQDKKLTSITDKCRILRLMPVTSMRSLLEYGQFSKHFVHEYIYKGGDKNKFIYIVISGELEVQSQSENTSYKKNSQGYYLKKRILRLKQGDHFGDESGLWAKRMDFSVQVISPTAELMKLPLTVRN